MNNVARKIKKAVRNRIHNFTRRNHNPDAQFDAVLQHLLRGQNPSALTILDVGSHRGESVQRFRKLFPVAAIHAFEPDEDNFRVLTQNCATMTNVILNNLGAGARRERLTFHRNLKSSTSSLNPVNVNSQWAQKRSAERGITVDQYTQKSFEVDITDLDSYIEDNRIAHVAFLKMDTQGHEDAVLDGCARSLERGIIDIIESELIVGDAYTKSLTFSDIEKRLLPHGYEFYGIDSHGDLLHTPWLSFNLIYVHKRLLAT